LVRTLIGSTAAMGVGNYVLKTSLPFPSLIGGLAGGATLLFVLVVLRDDIAWRALRMVIPVRTREQQT